MQNNQHLLWEAGQGSKEFASQKSCPKTMLLWGQLMWTTSQKTLLGSWWARFVLCFFEIFSCSFNSHAPKRTTFYYSHKKHLLFWCFLKYHPASFARKWRLSPKSVHKNSQRALFLGTEHSRDQWSLRCWHSKTAAARDGKWIQLFVLCVFFASGFLFSQLLLYVCLWFCASCGFLVFGLVAGSNN